MTPVEKISLIMMCEIQEHLEIQGEFEPDFVKSAILDGHLWALDWQYGGLSEPDVSPTIPTQVGAIMDMWSYIEFSVGELDASGRADLEANSPIWGKDPKFRGFDGNNETRHMSVARFMVEKMRRFTEFSGRTFNSHAPEVAASMRMLSEFRAVDHHGQPLNSDQLAKILNAR